MARDTEDPFASARAAPHRAVFVGGSAGGIEALVELFSKLPAELPAPVLVVLHVGKAGTSVLPAILDRLGSMHAVSPIDGQTLSDGVVYVAPRGKQMVVSDGRVRLTSGPTEHGLRPAIDPLFRSAALVYGPRAIGVILSGMLDDGTEGLRQIHNHGGWTIVQDPQEAAFPSMPESAIANVTIDYVLPVSEIPARIVDIVGQPLRAARTPAAGDSATASTTEPAGMRTDITCPQCGGVLWEELDGSLTMYRCRAGHAFSADSLLIAQGEGLDSAAWRQIRMLQERGALLRRLSDRATQQGRERSANYFRMQADEAFARAAEVRLTLHGSSRVVSDLEDDSLQNQNTETV